MRARRLSRWIAGGLTGCPGIVDVSPTEGSPPSRPAPRGGAKSAADDRPGQHSRRNAWLTAAAAILVLNGVVLRRWPSGRKRDR